MSPATKCVPWVKQSIWKNEIGSSGTQIEEYCNSLGKVRNSEWRCWRFIQRHQRAKCTSGDEKGQEQSLFVESAVETICSCSPTSYPSSPHASFWQTEALVYSAWSRIKLKLFCSFCYQRWQELQNNILNFLVIFKDVSFLTFELACTGLCVAEFRLNHMQCFWWLNFFWTRLLDRAQGIVLSNWF